jgi:Zn-dependent protease with chaperone function
MATTQPQRRFVGFAEYIEAQERRGLRDEHGTPLYAHPVDEWILRALNSTPVNEAIEKAVDSMVSMELGQYVVQGIAVDQKSFPDLFARISHCAATLDIPIPHAVVGDIGVLFNAFTAGTDEYSFIFITPGLSQYFTPEEAEFVIGHECGHIAARHMTYHTLGWLLTQKAFFKLFPLLRQLWEIILMPILAWSRRSEITCDRAGLLCCGDLAVAERALIRLVAGHADTDRVDIDDYLRKSREAQEYHGISIISQLMKSHPSIPQRIEALRLFARSEVYYSLSGKEPPPGQKVLSREELNGRIHDIVKP